MDWVMRVTMRCRWVIMFLVGVLTCREWWTYEAREAISGSPSLTFVLSYDLW